MWIQKILDEPPVHHRGVVGKEFLIKHFYCPRQVATFEVHILAFLVSSANIRIAKISDPPSSAFGGMGICLRIIRVHDDVAQTVGIGNPFQNATILRQTCDREGTKVQPSRLSLTTVATFAPDATATATATAGAHTMARKESIDNIVEILDSSILA